MNNNRYKTIMKKQKTKQKKTNESKRSIWFENGQQAVATSRRPSAGKGKQYHSTSQFRTEEDHNHVEYIKYIRCGYV